MKDSTKRIAPFHFITNEDFSVKEQVKICEEAGASLIQLRIKDRKRAEESLPELVLYAKQCQLTVVINDYVDLAHSLKADGVHLGKSDHSVAEARALLGTKAIIGATINSFNDVLSVQRNCVDYFGLGPFQYTTTKKKLSPLLGYDGIRSVQERINTHCPEIPVVAIGGITASVVPAILETGVHGVAVSSAVTRAENPVRCIQEFLQLCNSTQESESLCWKEKVQRV